MRRSFSFLLKSARPQQRRTLLRVENLETREVPASLTPRWLLSNGTTTTTTKGGPPTTPFFDLAIEQDDGEVGDRTTSFGMVTLVGQTTPNTAVKALGQKAKSDVSGRFELHDVPLELGDNSVRVTATRNGRSVSFTSTLTRTTVPGNVVVLSEGTGFVAETSIPVDLGVTDGTRVLTFALGTSFHYKDKAASGDTLLVSLVDANGTILLGSRGPTSPLLSISESGSEFQPGLVEYNGHSVALDVSSITVPQQGFLRFQLVSADTDTLSEVHLGAVTNTVTPGAEIGPAFVAKADAGAAPGATLTFKGYAALKSVQVLVENVRFDDATQQYTADLRLRNNGKKTVSRNLAVLLKGLPASVTLVNASGERKELPYLNFASVLPSGGLAKGATSEPLHIVLENPNLERFGLRPVVMGMNNAAPKLPKIGTQTVYVGGYKVLAFNATDKNNDTLTYRIDAANLPSGQQRADGSLVIAPKPGEQGTYPVTVFVSDGAVTVKRSFNLVVADDPITTTRVSGIICDSDGETPIRGIQVDVGALNAITDDHGYFEIDLGSGPPATLTVKVRGDLYENGQIYPFVAEKLPLLLERDLYTGVNNVIGRPIYLPKLDPNAFTPINPDGETIATTPAIPGMELRIGEDKMVDQLGAQYTGSVNITEVPAAFTPAVLPRNLRPDTVVTIQPSDMLFTQPAQITFPNRAGYAPGTTLDLWSINPSTGEFTDVGNMLVGNDGLIRTISGGVINSSWHFPAPPPPPNDDNPNDDDKNEDDNCEECKATGQGSSEVELHSGTLRESHALVTYSSMGETRGLSLHYDSLRADPRPILTFGYSSTIARANDRMVGSLALSRGDFTYQVPGAAEGTMGLLGGEHVWQMDKGGTVRGAIQADMRNLPTGAYDYALTSGILSVGNGAFSGTTSTQTGRLQVVNSRNSVFGAGWGLGGLLEIVVNPDDSLLVIDGSGGELRFGAPTTVGDPYASPPGDFSTFVKLGDGTYRRTFKDQSVQLFDADGRIVSFTDRNGNATMYTYNSMGISRITDPVGQATVFTYTNGRVSRITDPAGRATVLVHDSAGNLQSVTDPDGAKRTWTYDADAHMTGETDARGFTESAIFDFAGRVTGAVTKEGRALTFQPVQTQQLVRADLTSNPETAPAVFAKTPAVANYLDMNGNAIQAVLDKAGQAVTRRDRVGALPAVNRDNQNLVRVGTDSRGFVTSYDYDDKGNVTEVRDSVGGSSSGRITNEGREFWLGFPPNYQGGSTLTLSISSRVAASGTIEIPGLNFTQNFTTIPGEVTTVTLPSAAATMTSNAINARGIHVTSDVPVSVSGLNRIQFTTDGFLGLPVEALGTEYLVMSYTDAGFDGAFAVVGAFDDTQVTITLPRAMGVRPANTPFTVTLNQGEVYYLAGNDATGVLVTSDKPTAVFGSHVCANVPAGVAFCDHLVEQMPPISTWGREFVTAPLATRLAGDRFRFLSSVDGTVVRVDGSVVATLNRGEFYETTLTSASRISATEPLLVAQYSQGSTADGVPSDPFMLIVPPYEQFGNTYTINTPETGFNINYVNLIVPTPIIGSIRLDGQPIPAASFTEILSSSFSYAQVAIQPGSHRVSGSAGFGLFVYGFANDDSYGYLGGQGFTPGATKFFEYDNDFKLVSKMTDELGRITLYDRDPVTGNLRTLTQVVGALDDGNNGETNDRVTRYTYNTRGLMETMRDPEGRTTAYAYNALQQLVQVTMAQGTPQESTRTFGYDEAGNQNFVEDENGNITRYLFDERNRLIRTTEADPDGSGPLPAPTTRYTYDAHGNMLTLTDANGNTTRYSYDDRDRMIALTQPDPDGSGPLAAPITRYTYDTAGNLIALTDPLGQVTTHKYDARQRRIETTDPEGGVTRFGYDLSDNLIEVTDPVGNLTVFSYDARDRLLSEVDPLGERTLYTYDDANNLESKTDRNGRTTKFAYDDLNRLTQETWLNVGNVTANVVDYSYDKYGNLLLLADDTGSLTMTYDARHRLKTVSNAGTLDTPEVVLTYSYDSRGNVTTVSDTINGSNGATTNYNFDDLNRLTGLTQTGNGLTAKSVNFAYNGLGQYTAIDRTTNGVPSVTTRYTYDNMNRLESLTHRQGTTTVAGYGYGYDTDSRITSIDSVVDGLAEYLYDDRDQLTGANYANVTRTDETYAYDANGNRESSHLHGSNYETEPNTANRLQSDGTYDYTYDDEGNMLTRTTLATGDVRRFTWDHRNRLRSVTDETSGGVVLQEVTFTYDAMNRRISKTLNGTSTLRFVYDREDVLFDFANGATTPTVRYLHGPGVDQVLAEDHGSADVRWLLTDHLGSTRDIMNATGQVLNHLVLDSYGNVISQTDITKATRYVFTGRELDTETGLHYYRARYYDAAIGKFIADDQRKFEDGDPNITRYVGNSPLTAIDPSGNGKFGLVVRVCKMGLKKIRELTEDQAREAVRRGKDVLADSKKSAKRISKDKGKGKPIHDKGHVDKDGNVGYPHYHDGKRSGGHVFYPPNSTRVVVPGAGLGTTIFGDRVGPYVDFLNPLSDIEDVLNLPEDLFGGDEQGSGGYDNGSDGGESCEPCGA